MAVCRKLTSLSELQLVMRGASEISPLGKHVRRC